MKKSRAPGSTKQERMHIHKHTVDLTKRKKEMCWCHYLLCTPAEVEPVVLFVVVLALAGSVFWRPAEEVTVDAVLGTLELIKSSCLLPKEPLKERHVQWMHLYYLSLLIQITQSCEWSIKFPPMYSVSQLSLRKFWGKRSILFTISLTRTFNLRLQRAAEVSLSPDHFSTRKGDKEWNLTGLCMTVLIASTEVFIQGPQSPIFKLLFHPHWIPHKMQNFTPQLVRKENVINITPLTIFNQLNVLLLKKKNNL